MKEAAQVLQRLLRVVVSLGLVALCFGQAYARLVLLLYGGSSLAEGLAPLLLRTHTLAILLLAINGTTECYALATMDTSHLDKSVPYHILKNGAFEIKIGLAKI